MTTAFTRFRALALLAAVALCTLFAACGDDGPKVEPEPVNPPATNVTANTQVKVDHAEASSTSGDDNKIEKSFDNNFTENSYYSSRWQDGFPVTLTYYFKNVARIDYLTCHPRGNWRNTSGRIKEVEVWVKTEGAADFVKKGIYDFEGAGTPSTVIFSGGVLKPEAIRLKINSACNSMVWVGEMQFFVLADQNSDADMALFTDKTCSALRTGVTEAQVKAMNNTVLRTIATQLLKGAYPAEFRVQTFKPYPRPETAGDRNHTDYYSELDNPTGIIAEQGSKFVVFVGETTANLSIRVCEFDNRGYDDHLQYPLVPGTNVLTPQRTGQVYLMYHTDNASAQPVKVHFASGKVNGYYDAAKHGDSDWSRLINAAAGPNFDILGKYAHMNLPVAHLKSGTSKPADLISIYDSLCYWEQQHIGLVKYGRINKNRTLFIPAVQSYAGGGAYQTMYRISIFALSSHISKYCNPAMIMESGLWLLGHEVGHQNQLRPEFRWGGLGEVSNNVTALYVTTRFGQASTLMSESDGKNAYQQGYAKPMSDRTPWVNASELTRVVPFWILELYYSHVKGNADFYPDLYNKLRTTPAGTSDYGGLQMNFIKQCCAVAGENLTEFFEAWGMLTPADAAINESYNVGQFKLTQAQIDATKAAIQSYPAPKHKLQYLTEDKEGLYKNNTAVVAGGVTQSGRTLTLTGWSNAVAYEIYGAGGKLILATDKSPITLPDGAETAAAIGATGTKTAIAFTPQ